MKIFKKQKAAYRIMSDRYRGFEVQYRPTGYFPSWSMPTTNSHRSIEEAKEYIAEDRAKKIAAENAKRILHFEEVEVEHGE